MSNAIITENLNTGSPNWQIATSNNASTQIQVYADTTSLDPGSTINFYVSTQVASTGYQYQIYRMGYYQGTGGCVKASVTGRTGVAQGYWDDVGQVLNNCPTAISSGSPIYLLDAGWTITDSWAVPGGACTGIYIAKFTDANGWATVRSFVVRGNQGADYLIARSYTTDCAYNHWGGNSLYTNPGVSGFKVSFNRPNVEYNGGAGFFGFEVNIIKWLESQGYNIAYLSNIDTAVNPALYLTSKALISIGHDEYWTKSMRDGVEAAIASGRSAAFTSANASYWQCRLESDTNSNPNRTVVGYKCLTSNSNLSIDPQYGVNNALVTTQWRDPLLGRPENTMIGIMYSSYTNSGNSQWETDPSMDTTYTAGTGLTASTQYGNDLVGYEWDKIQSGGPANLKTIATTSVTNVYSQADTSNTTWYRAPSGALVFASGSIAWTWALDSYRRVPVIPAVVPGIQVLFANIMGALKGPVYGNLGGH